MDWYQELEDRLVQVAFDAASSVSDRIHHAELDLQNGGFKVVTKERLAQQDKQRIVDNVRDAIRKRVCDATKTRVRVCVGFLMKYSMHLDLVSQQIRRLPGLHDIVNFKVTASELHALRTVYNHLLARAETHDYIATTALGGVPGLLHLVESIEDHHRPEDVRQLPVFYEDIRKRFHLFPGLLWSGTEQEPDLLFDWLRQLPQGSSVLLFDTGTKGNGARRMADVVTSRMNKGVKFGPSLITVIGVVDGQDPSQEAKDTHLESMSGTIHLVIDYEHVPKMLTEDCQNLIGYGSLRNIMMLEPLSTNAVIEVVDDDGTHLGVIGAMSGASALRNVIQHHVPGTSVGDNLAKDVSWFTRALILCASMRKELGMLEAAFEFGLIDRDAMEKERRGIFEKYPKFVGSEVQRSWDFDRKKTIHK
jgi:hypothetical protein